MGGFRPADPQDTPRSSGNENEKQMARKISCGGDTVATKLKNARKNRE
jgi:hypothetical protein